MNALQFAISIISAMGLWRRSPQSVINDALNWGFNGVQMLPIRGATGEESDVLLFEDAWNAVPSFRHAFRHLPGASGEPSTLLDWHFFPPAKECQLTSRFYQDRSIPKIGHDFDDAPLVELHPGIGSIDQIVKKCQQTGTRLVFDPHHFTRQAREGKEQEANGGPNSPFGNHLGWQLWSLEILSPFIRVIHYQPIDDESIGDLLTDTSHNTTKTLVRRCLRWANVKIMVAEYRPPLAPWAVAGTAQKMLKAMHSIVNA